ncbi:MAG: 5-formyltetrahydrofolate cyclo-ligase [Corynebacterium sp.]|nr:5-formyltetrahydrofolate cyclo-ligase [Corynebacterium sp.]
MEKLPVSEAKKHLREAIRESRRERLLHTPAIELTALSDATVDQALRWLRAMRIPQGATVASFVPLPGEPMCAASLPLYKALNEEGYTAVLPKMVFDQLLFGPVEQWQTEEIEEKKNLFPGLHAGKFGILEPLNAQLPWNALDVVFVPALAVDEQGNRLGQGGGFYDKTAAQSGPGADQPVSDKPLYVAAIVWANEVHEVPVEGHDLRADVIITEEGFRFSETEPTVQ